MSIALLRVSGEGQNLSATGTATDNAGNTASATVTGINIDRTAPTVTFAGARAYTADETVQVTCTAADSLAGLAEDPCATPLVSAPAYTLAPGQHTVTVVAVDRAGNRTEVSATFTVGVTYASVVNVTQQLVTEQGTANSLVAKLNAAEKSAAKGNNSARDGQLQAYVNELHAQSGKKITAEQAQILETLALALQN